MALYCSPDYQTNLESFGLSVQEFDIDFQDGSHGGHLRFPNEMFLAIFDLHVTLILPMMFQVNWPFS